MTQAEKNVAYVGALLGVVLMSVPASRDFIIELATVVGAIIWFGTLIVWNWVISLSVTVVTGVVTGLVFAVAAVAHEHARR